jgi:hypothetical protein
MTIAEKVLISKNEWVLTLFKEGLFYKCFNEDAMVFTQRVRNYKITSKYVKSIGEQVLSIGFPSNEIEKNKTTLEAIKNAINASSFKIEDQFIEFNLVEQIKLNFQEFLKIQNTKIEAISAVKNKKEETSNELLLKSVKEFDLVNSTPMQCILFIQELKKMC